jgi:hypothetical protein
MAEKNKIISKQKEDNYETKKTIGCSCIAYRHCFSGNDLLQPLKTFFSYMRKSQKERFVRCISSKSFVYSLQYS